MIEERAKMLDELVKNRLSSPIDNDNFDTLVDSIPVNELPFVEEPFTPTAQLTITISFQTPLEFTLSPTQ